MSAKICNIAGVLVLLLAANTYKHYKGLIISMNLTVSSSPPIDVIVELIVAFLLILFGQLQNLRLKPIKVSADIKGKHYDETMGRSDFAVFNHRGKALADRVKNAK